MELHADEPGVLCVFDDFRQHTIRRQAGELQAVLLQPVLVGGIDLVAVTVALGNLDGAAIDFRDPTAALERRGLLSRHHEDGAFGIEVNVEEVTSDAICEVPLLGRIAAGEPIDAVAVAESISVPRFLLGRVRPERVYALRVKGDSMIDEHICDGDIALIENRTEARDGEIVVALIEGTRATLKRLFRFGAMVELRPANPQLQPIRLPASQVSVQGIFRGLLRPST